MQNDVDYVLISSSNQRREDGLVALALTWDSRNMGLIPGSAADFLCELGQVALLLWVCLHCIVVWAPT